MYGFNGQEKTPEIAPNTTTAEFWQYDARVGRRWNLDPKPTVGISQYSAFNGNPIWYSDIKGDSIVDPNRTTPVNIYVVPIQKDKTTKMDYSRLLDTKGKYKTLILHADELNSGAADKIKAFLGKDGYINNMVIDYHRSDYDKMDKTKQKEFYTSLANGFTGNKTTVLLGMCWAGGLELSANDRDNLPDLTGRISEQLDKATVYGLKTEANSLGFYFSGNFGVTNPAYYYGKDKWSRHERAYESEWTVSSFSNSEKKYVTSDIYKTVKLALQGDIIIKAPPAVPPN